MADELTLRDAASELGMSYQRLQVLAKEGRLGHQVAGRYWVFSRSEIEEYKPLVKQSKGGRPSKFDGLPTIQPDITIGRPSVILNG